MRSAFVGRHRELAALAEALDEARAGHPSTVLIEGVAGMGKTVLVRHFVESIDGVSTLRASGEEVEAALPYGVLDQLRSAAGQPQGDYPPDPLAAGAGLLELLGDLQGAGPVVVVVDDAHWSDTPSMHALVFALRRLRADRVLALLTARQEEAARLPAALWRLVERGSAKRMVLDGLTENEVDQLAGAMGAGALSAGASRRLHRHTGGNPLHTVALLEELGSEGLITAADPLPAPRSFQTVVVDRLAACSPRCRDLLFAGAVLGRRWPLTLAASVAGIDEPLAAAEEGVNARLISITVEAAGPSAAFTHPLVRAAVYHDLGPAGRARLHQLAAELVDDEGTALRHRAAASPGPDAALADELEAHAASRAAVARAGADGYLLAARLSPARKERDRRLLEAFEYLVAAGDMAEALDTARLLEDCAHEGWRSYARGLLAHFGGRLPEAEPLLRRASEACDPVVDRAVAGRCGGWLAIAQYLLGQVTDALRLAQRAVEIDPDARSPNVARSILNLCLAITGRCAEGLAMVESLPDPALDPPLEQINDVLGRGFLRMFSDDCDGARRDLMASAAACRRHSVHFYVVSLFYLSDVEYRLGRWRDALVHGQLAVSAAEDGDFLLGLPVSRSTTAWVLAGLGELEAAAEYAHAARGPAEAIGDTVSRLYAAVAEARTAQAAHDPHWQAAACERMADVDAPELLDAPALPPWRELYAEALVRLGRLNEAECVLEPLEARAAEWDVVSAYAGAARVRAMLEAARGRATQARATFDLATDLAQSTGMPFGLAQTELALGGFLRRQGQRRAAISHLQLARERLSALGARPFLSLCDKELAACGLTPAARSSHAPHNLTPQELSVAHLVSTGLTNREVASELVLSVKTVEYHLSNIYAKLGVKSRTQLVVALPGIERR